MKERKHYILFVDDDPLVLRGLKRSLGEYDDVWSVDFAPSGRDALARLKELSFDAVVTDMHMPGMDGIQLLELVNQNYPGVMRFVLSGNFSDTQALHSTQLVHQMIPKPCDIEHIFSTVERACRLRDMLSDPQLRRIITGIKSLPSVPLLYNRLLQELQSENATAKTIGDIIAQDTAMTAKVLQLVNSAFFGLAENVSSPHRAVTILGFNTVKALVLGVQVFSEYQEQSNSPFSINALWKHSLLVSCLAYDIARSLELNMQDQENARVSGILHDVGRLMLLQIPGYFQQALASKKTILAIETEYQILGTSHAEMGAYLLGIWGLPSTIVEAIIFHHTPARHITIKAELATALHIANGLANMCQFGKDADYSPYLDLNYLQNLGVVDHLDEWAAKAREKVENAKN